MDVFDEEEHMPKCLPCGHTSCRSCLKQLLGTSHQAPCPVCRQPFQGGDEKLVSNLILVTPGGQIDSIDGPPTTSTPSTSLQDTALSADGKDRSEESEEFDERPQLIHGRCIARPTGNLWAYAIKMFQSSIYAIHIYNKEREKTAELKWDGCPPWLESDHLYVGHNSHTGSFAVVDSNKNKLRVFDSHGKQMFDIFYQYAEQLS